LYEIALCKTRTSDQFGFGAKNVPEPVRNPSDQLRLLNTIRIFRMLEEEYERTCRVTLQITGERHLLDQSPALQRTIAVRNPYDDPLSFMQVELLARRRYKNTRTEPSDGDREKLLYVTLLTINGIAAGMRSTG
jgi:phosphoenolpyruvate carboxylase